MYFLNCGLDRSSIAEFTYGIYALSSLITSGMSMGFSSVALPLLTQNSTSNDTLPSLLYDDESAAVWFASITSIAIICGCISSVLTMKAGRKVALAAGGIVSIIGWIIIATSYFVSQLLIGRFITGFATGLAATPAPVYSAEIATPRYRTAMTASANFFICTGILFIYFFGFIIPNNWRLVAATSSIIPILSVILILLFLPESPRWLIIQNQPLKAKEALLRLRGLTVETREFTEEFNQLVMYHEKSSINTTLHSMNNQNSQNEKIKDENVAAEKIQRFWLICKLPEVWKPFVILNTFFILQQFCGIYVLMVYSVDLVVSTGITVDPYLVTVLIGIVQAIGAVVLTLCSSRMGRKPASIISGIGMAISLGVLAVCMQLNNKNGGNVDNIHSTNSFSAAYSAIPIAMLLLFVATGSFGFLAIPWAMIGELYPSEFVNVLGPVTTCLEGLFNFASIQIYPLLIYWNFIGTIYFYCSVSIIGVLFVIFVLPETHGRTKTQIEAQFKNN